MEQQFSATSPLTDTFKGMDKKTAKKVFRISAVFIFAVLIAYAITIGFTSKMLWEATPDDAKNKYTVHEVISKWTRIGMILVTGTVAAVTLWLAFTMYTGYKDGINFIKKHL